MYNYNLQSVDIFAPLDAYVFSNFETRSRQPPLPDIPSELSKTRWRIPGVGFHYPKNHWTLQKGGVWLSTGGFWDLQTISFEIPWFLG